jgi:hypothetical protein
LFKLNISILVCVVNQKKLEFRLFAGALPVFYPTASRQILGTKNMLAAAGGTGYTENNQSTQFVEKKELAAPCMHTLSALG